MENRQKFLDDYCSSETKEIEPKYGMYDHGLTSRIAEKKSETWYSRLAKYAKRAVVSAILAAGVLMPGYCTEAALSENVPAAHKQIEQPAQKRTSGYFDFIRGAFDKKYDNHNCFHKDSLEELIETTHKVYGHITVEVTEYDYSSKEVKKKVSERTLTGIGSCVVVGKDKKRLTLVTCDHVVTPPKLADEYDEKQRPLRKYKIKETSYVLEQEDITVPILAIPFVGARRISSGPELKVIARDETNDVAILQTNPEESDSISDYKVMGSWGNTKELKEGDFLYILGFPQNITKQVMSGHVASLGNPFTPADDFIFYADATINKGNSGGPVYALRDGKPELVGITSRLFPEGIGGIVKVENIVRLLRKAGLGKLCGDKK